MRTARFSYPLGVSLHRPPGQTPWTETAGQRPPSTETLPEQRPTVRNTEPGVETPRKNMGPGSQTGSDSVHRALCMMTHASENITLPQTSFAGSKIMKAYLFTSQTYNCYRIEPEPPQREQTQSPSCPLWMLAALSQCLERVHTSLLSD